MHLRKKKKKNFYGKRDKASDDPKLFSNLINIFSKNKKDKV